MPKYMIEVPDVHHAVTRPIIRQVADVVIRNFSLEQDVKQIVINGLNDVIPTNNSTLNSGNNPIRVDSDSRLEIEFEEEVVNPVSIAILRDEHMPILDDKDLHVFIKPVYAETSITLTFKYIAKDQSTATAWQRRAELQAYRAMNKFLTNVDYHYSIPIGIARQLWVIHALRERAPTRLDENFGKWLRRISTKRLTTISNLANGGIMFAVPELQSRVHGWFDFAYQPQKVEKHNDASAWTAGFSLTFHYDRPDALIIQYPLVIHNQLIPAEYRDDQPPEKDTEHVATNRALSLQALGIFEKKADMHWYNDRTIGVAIPYFDDWLPNHIEAYHTNTTHILMQFDYDDPKFVIDWNDPDTLGDYDMHDPVREYMRDLKNHMFIPYDTLFLVSLQRWNQAPVIRDMQTDETLRVELKYELDTTAMYHLVINTLHDLSKLSAIGREILGRHPWVVENWLKWRYPDDWWKIPLPFRPDGTIDIDKLIDILNDRSKWDDNATRDNPARWDPTKDDPTRRSGWRYGEYRGKPGMNMVESFNIIAFRKSDANLDISRMAFEEPWPEDNKGE